MIDEKKIIIPGTTATLVIELCDTLIDTINSAVFTINKSNHEETPTLQKDYPGDDVSIMGETIYILLNQEETLLFEPDCLYIEGQLNFTNNTVGKTETVTYSVGRTQATTIIEGNTASISYTNVIKMTVASRNYIVASMQEITDNVGLSQTAADEAETARDESVAAKDMAVTQANAAATSANNASTSEANAQTAANQAETARNESISAKDTSVEQANAAATSANEAGMARDESVAAKYIAVAQASASSTSANNASVSEANSQTAANTAVLAKDESVAAKNTAVDQANAASLNKDATDDNVSTTTALAGQVTSDLQTVTNLVAECQAVLQQQYQALATMPTTYWVGTLAEVYEIANPKEMDTCFVASDDKQSLYMYYTHDIEGNLLSEPAWVFVTDLNLLSLNRDYLLNILQLASVATSGSYSDLTDKPKRYESLITVSDGVWDYSTTDKIILTADLVSINNVYNGAVGVIKTDIDILLPQYSKKAIDYDYMDLADSEYYFYTFMYDGSYFHWSRVVCS